MIIMQKSLDSMANDFMTIRAGRANPHVLDKVKVDYYGVATPVAQVGNVFFVLLIYQTVTYVP